MIERRPAIPMYTVGTSEARASALSISLTTLVVVGFVFIAFFPNPAIPLGGALGLQFGHLLALALTPFVLLRRPTTSGAILVFLVAGSAVFTGFFGLMVDSSRSTDLTIKMIVLLLFSTVVAIPLGAMATPRRLPAILLGASAAIIVNALIGLYQIRQFEAGSFPFLGLYNNGSFASMAADVETYVTYVKRPFGLFPEPSAMGACVGPWVTLIAGVILRGDLRGRYATTVRRVGWGAVILGVVLMFIARSGYTAIWLPTIAPVLAFYPISRMGPGMKRSLSVFFGGIVVIVAAVMIWSSTTSTVSSSNIESNGSWASRQQSIVISLTQPFYDPVTFLIGFGPGQSATYMMRTPTEQLLPSWYSTDQIMDVFTIWSMIGTYFMENGIVGGIVLVVLIGAAVRSIARSSARLLGLCVLLGWFFGVLIATSYFPLSPPWMILTLLLVWSRVFPRDLYPSDESLPMGAQGR